MKKLKRTGIRRIPKSKMIRILSREFEDHQHTEELTFVFKQLGQGRNFPFLGLGH